MSTAKTGDKGAVARPLSPHLQIYRTSWTMAMSIIHRITGAALYFGTVLLAIWLVAAASGPKAYDAVSWIYGSFIGRLVLVGYTWALFHHMLGGLRHFVWDAGRGLEPGPRLAMAKFSLFASLALTALVWALVIILSLR